MTLTVFNLPQAVGAGKCLRIERESWDFPESNDENLHEQAPSGRDSNIIHLSRKLKIRRNNYKYNS